MNLMREIAPMHYSTFHEYNLVLAAELPNTFKFTQSNCNGSFKDIYICIYIQSGTLIYRMIII